MGDDCAQTFYPNLNVTLYFQQKQQSLAVPFQVGEISLLRRHESAF